jgi:hypothetical protein
MSFLQRACGPAGGGAHSIFKLNVGIRTLYLYTHTITRNGSHFTSPSLAEKGGFFRLSATRKRLREPSPSYTVQLHLAHTISIALRATAGFNSRGRTALHCTAPLASAPRSDHPHRTYPLCRGMRRVICKDTVALLLRWNTHQMLVA